MNKELLNYLGIFERNHNIIWFEHMEDLCCLFQASCPCSKEDLLSDIKMKIGLTNRSAMEYIKAFEHKKLLKKEGKIYKWCTPWIKEPNPILLDEMKNEDVPDTFPGNVGIKEIEIKPCTQRNDKMVCSVITGHSRLVSPGQCNSCGSRQEA